MAKKETNEAKLEALKAFLRENGIEFLENYKSSFKVMIDLKIPKYRIAVKIGDDDYFYNRVLKYYKPFFIRDTETSEFIIEKMQNCILTIMQREQRSMERKAHREEYLKEQEEAHKRKLERRKAHEERMRKMQERRNRDENH